MRLPFRLPLGRKQEPGPQEQRASGGSLAEQILFGATDTSWSSAPRDVAQLIMAAVENPWEWASISKIASSAALADVVIKTGGRTGTPVKETNPWLLRLTDPNDFLTDYDLWEETVAWMESCGSAYWVLDRSAPAGQAPYIEVVSPALMEVVPDPTRRIKGYKYYPNGRKGNPDEAQFLKREDVIHFKSFNPVDALAGLSPQVSLWRNLQTDRYATEYNMRFFKNGANISGVLETDDVLGDVGVRSLRKQFLERQAGLDNAHVPLVLEGGLKWKQTGAPPKDMEFLQGRKYDRETILGFHGTPPVLMGVLEHANYSNVDAQYLIFWKDTITTRQAKIAARIRKVLWRETGDRTLWFEFDNSKVPALQEPIKTTAYVVDRMVRIGVFSRNEGRLRLGLDPKPGYDDLTVDKPVAPAEPAEPTVSTNGTGKSGGPVVAPLA